MNNMAKPTFDPNQPFDVTQESDAEKPAFDPNQPYEQAQGPQDESLMGSILSGVGGALETVDSYTGAPVRSGISAALEGENPFSAYGEQFGESPRQAPTGQQISEQIGISDTPLDMGPYTNPKTGHTIPRSKESSLSLSDITGFGIDVVADPLLLIGSGAKLAGKGAKAFDKGLKSRKAFKAMQSQKAKATASAEAKSTANISGGDLSVEQSGELFKYKSPESLDELRQWQPPKGMGQVKGKARLKEIENIVPDLKVKPLKYHYDMMENPKAMKELKLKFENLPTGDAKKIAAYNQGMVDESLGKIKTTIKDIGGAEPRSMTDAGYDFIESAKTKYKSEKEVLGPLFQNIQERSRNLNQIASKDLIIHLSENSKIGKLLQQDDAGRFLLRKNSPRTGLSDSEHKILSRVIDDLNDGMTFKELQETREFLRKAVDPMNPGATAEINKVRKILLNQLEDMSGQLGDDVHKVFKSYAINERSREAVEKIIGGKIESLDAMFSSNPDKVVKKIFYNPNHAKVVSEYVGEEAMDKMVSSYIQSGLNKALDSAKGFAPHTFKNWLKSNRAFLETNVSPNVVSRLDALADYGYYGKRFLDEVNPSGTAASLKEMIEPRGFTQKVSQKGLVGAVTSEVGSRVSSVLNQKQAVKFVDEALGKKSPRPKPRSKYNFKKSFSKKNQDRLSIAAKAQAVARGSNVSISEKKEKELKGYGKWAKDGFVKLQESASGEQKSILNKLDFKGNSKLKKMMISASSMKAGSKKLKKLLEKITSEYKGEK